MTTNARGSKTMIMYIMIVHKRAWYQIKRSEVVMNHLKKHNIWAYIDEFNTKKVGSPGFITELHPCLTNLKTFKTELESKMRDAECDEENVVHQWKEKNEAKDDMYNQIPKFTMNFQTKRWGEAPK